MREDEVCLTQPTSLCSEPYLIPWPRPSPSLHSHRATSSMGIVKNQRDKLGPLSQHSLMRNILSGPIAFWNLKCKVICLRGRNQGSLVWEEAVIVLELDLINCPIRGPQAVGEPGVISRISSESFSLLRVIKFCPHYVPQGEEGKINTGTSHLTTVLFLQLGC